MQLVVLGLLLLLIDPFIKKDQNRRVVLGWLTFGGLVFILIVSLLLARPGEPVFTLGGMIRYDSLAFIFKMLFVFGAAISALFMMDVDRLNLRAEAYLLLLAATLGMSLMASAADLIMLYLSIETTSIPLYILAGFFKDDKHSTEAGFKYMLFGAFTSAILLYGFSLLYGLTGKTSLYELSPLFLSFDGLALAVFFLILVGLAFKISLVPFHFWAPDVYQGAPTPVAGFLSTASKAAGFSVVLRVLTLVFPYIAQNWSMILAVLATLTMTVGNLLALGQNRPDGNIKRLRAYSSIAHAGYAMIGVVAFSPLGAASTTIYLIAYILTNLAAFGIVSAFYRHVGSDELKAYSGLSRRNATLAFVMLVVFLSLAGMPPFGGFIGKVFVFLAAIQQGWIWLAFVGVINSIIGLYYYLTVLKYVFLYRMEGENEHEHPLPVTKPYVIGLAVLTVGIVLVGVVLSPWFSYARQVAASLFNML